MTTVAATPRVRLRRAAPPFRMELTPLIDVIFLLLTFFIYAMVLMERIELVPMDLHSFDAVSDAKATDPPPAVTLSFDAEGVLYLDRDAIALEDVVPAIEAALAQAPDTVLYLAVANSVGSHDRVPMLLELWDRLRSNDLPVRMVSTPMDAP